MLADAAAKTPNDKAHSAEYDLAVNEMRLHVTVQDPYQTFLLDVLKVDEPITRDQLLCMIFKEIDNATEHLVRAGKIEVLKDTLGEPHLDIFRRNSER